METNQLAVQAKKGDLKAFEQLYDGFAQRIFCYIRTKVQNRQDAEDLLQEVFIKSYRGLASLRPGKLNFSAWLFKITNNTVNDHFRKKYRTPEIVSIEDTFDLADGKSLYKNLMTQSDLETARENFKYLSVQHRTVLELRFFQQLSISEVARVLNKSGLAVRMLQYRARKRLKSLLEKIQERQDRVSYAYNRNRALQA